MKLASWRTGNFWCSIRTCIETCIRPAIRRKPTMRISRLKTLISLCLPGFPWLLRGMIVKRGVRSHFELQDAPLRNLIVLNPVSVE